MCRCEVDCERPFLHVAAALEVDQRESEAPARVPPRDLQDRVVDSELGRVRLDAPGDLGRERDEHQFADEHELHHARPERRVAAPHLARERFRPEPRHRGRRDREARHRFGQRFDHEALQPGEAAIGRDRGRDAARDEPRLGRVGRCEEDVFGGGERNGHGARQLRASAGYSWTSSIRVPNAVFGCTKATVVPRDPGRGCSSITR